jgi:hypothetical protein
MVAGPVSRDPRRRGGVSIGDERRIATERIQLPEDRAHNRPPRRKSDRIEPVILESEENQIQQVERHSGERS